MKAYYELRRRNKDEIGSLYSLNTSGDISQLKIRETEKLRSST
ncbi:hypothetical protein SAMN05660236_4752 [Ohtaekwangia koreensis]|uniref:Uncharacterized protein n=1 Tax=Ohtaekwangia koreensis TaxID=688867 RepID=A0A1T5M8L4_9BACT|nr:hypothetical protein SAMN05660236_4752 [Ohtaekwangia koreensis]